MNELIQTTRLPSGLTVVTERMDRVETVSFGAYVATGSRNETEAENGDADGEHREARQRAPHVVEAIA